jgi:hypothetical protein
VFPFSEKVIQFDSSKSRSPAMVRRQVVTGTMAQAILYETEAITT